MNLQIHIVYLNVFQKQSISKSSLSHITTFTNKCNTCKTSKLAQQGKVLATKPNNLSFIPGTHMAEGENQLYRVVLQLPHAFHGHTHVLLFLLMLSPISHEYNLKIKGFCVAKFEMTPSIIF